MSSNAYEVVTADVNDAKGICDFLTLIGFESDFVNVDNDEGYYKTPKDVAQEITGYEKDQDGIIMLIKCPDTGSVLCWGTSASMKRRKAHVWVLGICVKKSHWRQGLGLKMMQALISESKKMGAEKLSLAVSCPNVAAIKLYERLGFVTEGVLKDDFKTPSGELVDEQIMALML